MGWPFTRGKTEMTVTVHPRLVVSTIEAGCDAASAGIGITRALCYHVADRGRSAHPTVLDEYRLAPWPISFVYAAGRFVPIKLRASLDFAAPRLKARLVK
jgi:DNA-binding transcriptional LysR family regulator